MTPLIARKRQRCMFLFSAFAPASEVGAVFMSWFARSQRRHDQEKLAALDRSLAISEFAPDGTVLACNANYHRVMGYAPGELLGKSHRLFVDKAQLESDDYKAFSNKLLAGEFQSGVVQAAAQGRLHRSI